VIAIDVKKHTIELRVGADEVEARRSRWRAPELKAKRGTLYKYVRSVSTASLGCVTDEAQ
jgi:dihydroxy-acid dehydratase